MDKKIIEAITFEKERVFPIIAFAVGLLYTSYKLVELSNSKTIKSSREIPVPTSSYLVVGHMLSLGEFPGATVHKWHEQLGPIIKLHMGVQTWIMVADPILAQKILVLHGTKSAFRPYSHFSYHIHSKRGA